MSNLKLPQKPLEPFNVLAFDPGGTTGVAQAILRKELIDLNVEDFGNVTVGAIELRTTEMGPNLHHQELYEFIEIKDDEASEFAPPLEVVSEPFHYRQNVVGDGGKFRGKVELVSAEYIGVIKLACTQLGLSYYDRFTPGEAKAYVTDEKLRRLGWLQEPITPMRHRNDALRQLVKYLIAKKGVQHPITTAWRI